MKIEKVNYASDPERITTEPFDCLWVQLKSRAAPSPLEAQPLQWVDWKLQGQLSRFLQHRIGKASEGSPKTTFLPTMKKLPFPFLALHSEVSVDWTAFLRNCEGMKMKSVLIFCEESGPLEGFERELRRIGNASFPERIVLAGGSVPRGGNPAAGNG